MAWRLCSDGIRNVDAEAVRWEVRGYSMVRVAATLEALMQTPVRDRTGLEEAFDLDLTFVRDTALLDADPAVAVGGVSPVTALGEQAGLALEARSATMDVLVIDHIERPSPD